MKYMLIGTLLSFALASHSYAAGLPILKTKSKAVKVISKRKAMKAIAPNCVDFSGEWVGKCSTDGQTWENQEDVMVIKQEECKRLEIGGFDIAFNGSLSVQQIEDAGSYNYDNLMTLGLVWNDAQTKAHVLVNLSAARGTFAGVWRSSLYMVGDELRFTDEESLGFMNITGDSNWTMTKEECVYTRKQ